MAANKTTQAQLLSIYLLSRWALAIVTNFVGQAPRDKVMLSGIKVTPADDAWKNTTYGRR